MLLLHRLGPAYRITSAFIFRLELPRATSRVYHDDIKAATDFHTPALQRNGVDLPFVLEPRFVLELAFHNDTYPKFVSRLLAVDPSALFLSRQRLFFQLFAKQNHSDGVRVQLHALTCSWPSR